MTPEHHYPWPFYYDLQQRSRKISPTGDYAAGIERAMDYLLDSIEAGSVPANPEDLKAELRRAIASGARLWRSRAVALDAMPPAEPVPSGGAAAEARIELARIGRLVSLGDRAIITDVGLGYSDREIADRRGSSPGALRVRLSRLRVKLAA